MATSTTGGVVQVNGAAIHYDIAGAGFPPVLLHAGICDRRMWDEQMPELAEHFRVIRYDLRGFRQTPMPLGPSAHLADLAGLLLAPGIERAAWPRPLGELLSRARRRDHRGVSAKPCTAQTIRAG